MNRFVVSLVTAIAIAFVPALVPPVQAASSSAMAVPVSGTAATGEKFVGTFNLLRFVNDNGRVVAVGTVVGTVTNANGAIVGTALQTVSLPVDIPQPTGTSSGAIQPAAIGCSILHLDLGPLTLNLLGLQIDLSRVVLDITAIPGAGNLLGNLLCAVANLLNNPGGLTTVLNGILQILSGLGL